MLHLPDSPLLSKTRELARAVQLKNGRALLVGGFVRDSLLGQSPKDADVEVYGLPADELKRTLETLGRVDAVGESFRVLKLVWRAKTKSSNGERERFELDVSLPRRDRKVGTGHKGFEVEGDPFASIEDAARRRDFTLNAILCDPLTGEILDPFGGRLDLELRTLRAVDARHFGEDSLRVLRAMQFAARFELQIEPGTNILCRKTPLDDLPKERIWGEWEKWLLKSKRPSLGLVAGWEIGVFARLFPFLEAALQRNPAEVGASLDRAAHEIEPLDYPEKVALMLAVLGSFLGWRDTKALLEILGVQKLKGQGNAVDVAKLVVQLVGARKTPRDWFERREQVEDKEFRFFSARVPPALTVHLARARGFFEAANWFESNCARLGVLDGPPARLLLGRHLIELGLQPGPQMGQILERVYFLQLSGEVETLEDATTRAKEMF